jgi:thiamine transport system ATP-binding protein
MLRLERLELAQGSFRLTADLEVAQGASVALLGPSGGGKSTLLAAIAGFLAPRSGRVLWRGQDLGPLAPGQRPVSVLFQDNNLFPHLTALQNVALGLRPTLRPRPEETAQAAEALNRVGLSGLESRRPSQLSGGQQARAALARVLVQNRPLVLMDEAFGALGPALKAEMLALTRKVLVQRGATILMVTHDPEDAMALAESIVVVAEGQAQPPQATAALLAAPPSALRAYLGARR